MPFSFKIGGVDFIDCYVPLAFGGRYFVVEPGADGLLISVFLQTEEGPVAEIQKNEPVENPQSSVTAIGGFLAVGNRATGRFLYKVRPGSETSIIFATPKGDKIPALLSDRRLQIGERVYMSEGAVVSHEGSRRRDSPGIALLSQRFQN